MSFKNSLRDYFTFNRRERNGIFVLLSIIVVLLIYLSLSDRFYQDTPVDFSKFENEISNFEAQQKRMADSVPDEDSSENSERRSFGKKNASPPIPPFPLPPLQRERGLGGEVLELNSADTSALKELNGIGPAFAKRIIAYREKLGGFVNKEQLMEVYGFDKEKFDLVSSYVEIDVSKVKRININSASVDDLRKHPYCDKKSAVKIFMQRVDHGDYTDVQDIRKLNLADDAVFTKLVPYLSTK